VLGRIKNFANTTELKLWHMGVAFLLSTLLTTCVQQKMFNDNFNKTTLSERSKPLHDASGAFEQQVYKFINSGSPENGISEDEVSKVLQNIEPQLNALTSIEPMLKSGQQKHFAQEYQHKLIALRKILADGFEFSETRDFGSAALAISESKENFLASIS
jgi:hypothetical protein